MARPVKNLLVNCIAAHKAGTFTVAFNLLASFGHVSNGVKIFAIVPAGYGYEKLKSETFEIFEFKRGRGYFFWRVYFDQFKVPMICKRNKIDVLLNLNNIPVLFPSCPQILMLHQANLIRSVNVNNGIWQKINFLVQKILFDLGVGSCSKIIVQTRIMKEWLMASHIRIAEKIIVIKSGFESRQNGAINETGVVALLKQASGIKALCVSAFYPTKNLEVLVGLAKLVKERNLDIKVFLTIGAQAGSVEFLSNINKEGLDGILLNLGELTREQVSAAYRIADVFVLPTLLESFGLVYLEAMQAGCPIATSDMDFARYICEDSALYFDPHSPNSVLDAIEKIGQDRKMKDMLIANGKRVLSGSFKSWDEVAAGYLDAIESING